MKRFSYNEVYRYFQSNDCELLEKKYRNSVTKMRYRCSCGNISEITFGNFKVGKRCRNCSGRKKFTYQYVSDFFKDRGCFLLEKSYKDTHTKMEYKCKCGNIDEIRFNDFKKGCFCHKCAIGKRAGENHYNYNPNLTDEERVKNNTRIHSIEYRDWRKKVFKKNDYCCQKCLKKGVILNAHHIKNWASNIEGRHEVSNGITFCEKCHNEFHSVYGKKNNNEIQIGEFIDMILVGV